MRILRGWARRGTLISGFILFVGFNGAQANQQEAYEALRTILGDMQNLQGEFEQRIYENDELLQNLTGRFVIARPAQVYWETLAPEQTVLVADGETLWYYDPFIEQVTLFNQNEMTASNPLLMLLDQQIEGADSLHVEQNGQIFTVVSHQDENAQTLRLEFSDDHVLVGIQMETGTEQLSDIRFTRVELNQSIANDLFDFEVPENVQVDDQRSR
ncbi:MAG: outer membrane lipoprotein carrier protein LolA [Idiomarinaceae bacterium HL-53]|nr:MAG: outer membrane lipoprotein carrier protein LolA [Idiomarinaceae bacterium HL-53]CUS49050.1 outer membrane lipoprotein carrier protein [Idiomarinaceae bacterium HL-53]